LHTKVTLVASVAANVKVAELPVTDAAEMTSAGTCVSTVKLWTAGDGSVLPSRVART
jgi:hypothetical protein